MKKIILSLSLLLGIVEIATSQDLHFSQYYNAPILLNTANTGLMDNNWRAGLNFRNQWGTTPIPFNTASAAVDFNMMRDKWETSWIGTGIAVWRDVAGDGNLALTKAQANLAYHLMVSDRSTLSAGLGAAYCQRSVDVSKLTFDVQWDEFSFNRNASNQETFPTQKTNFWDLSAGINYSYFNDDNLYIKVGLGGMHINQPQETFMGKSNRKGFRPLGNIEIVYKASDGVQIVPSIYYTREKKASELVMGSLFNINTGGGSGAISNQFVMGAFYRNKDAIIATAGYMFRNSKFMFSYDQTVSQMSQGNNGMGAFELSLIIQGDYKRANEKTRTYGCPRF